MVRAQFLRARGVVQGVGFRPFVFRLARKLGLKGWVLNAEEGVQIHIEGPEEALRTFVPELTNCLPPAASIADLVVLSAAVQGYDSFEIRNSERRDRPTVRVSPDLPVCASCLEELFAPNGRRFSYPYINCTDCGPRYSIILGLPYDRPSTTMKDWVMCADCAREYHDPSDRRFHAQPVACPRCGPHFVLKAGDVALCRNDEAIRQAALLLGAGKILAIKGLGGYHLACDARNSAAVQALRDRKYRKEQPFAVMARSIESARTLVRLSSEAEELLLSVHRPIVLAPALIELPAVAPENRDLGVILPYAPHHHLLFACGAPELLVMTSANRSSEPIAYQDREALERLSGIADAYLVGERPIARRVDDSVVRVNSLGPVVIRRARGYAPGAVARIPVEWPILAVGADLKNTVTLVVGGEAFVSQHIGDLEHYEASLAFQHAIGDLMSMYEVDWERLLVVHDLHPQYTSTWYAQTLPVRERMAVQHHRALVASVLPERGTFGRRVLGVAFDGTGYGEDGATWGREFFIGSAVEGFERVAHLRVAALPGGDAAARHPVQSAAGFLFELNGLPDLAAPPFGFADRYRQARLLIEKGVRTYPTTSVGRLFDTVAALLGFTREISFEGQAAIWLEQLARTAPAGVKAYPMPFAGDELDFLPTLDAVVEDRKRGRSAAEIAMAFHRGLARGVADGIVALCETTGVDTAVLSGGVFQNEALLQHVQAALASTSIHLWTNREVPPNDGGISLGQAALALRANPP